MKDHAKVGNRNGRPGYRTPSSFRIRQNIKVAKNKVNKPVDKSY